MIDRIKESAAKQGFSMQKLARECGLTGNAGNQWGAYNAFPVKRNMDKISLLLGVTMSWLLTGNNKAEEAKAQTSIELDALLLIREMPKAQQEAALAALRGIAAMDAKK